jgi:hypothetical protein
MDMIEKSIPPKLYKYQSIDPNDPKCHTLDNLRNCHLWFSKIQDLNDPFDCAISIKFSSTNNELLEFFEVYLDSLRKQGKSDEIPKTESQYLTDGKPNSELKNLLKRRLWENDRQRLEKYSQWGVACLTQQLDSILMWSHYANGHKGLCLEFDTNYSPFHERKYLHQVNYSNSYPKLSVMDIIQSPNEFIKPVTTKFKKWKYEEEWRIIKDKGGEPLEYDPKALTAIYFGCSMPDDHKKLIAAMPAKSAARLYYMKRSNKRFELEAVPYSG